MSEAVRAVGRLRTAMKLDIPPTQVWRQDIATVLSELERVQADNAHLRAEKAMFWAEQFDIPWYHRLLQFLRRKRA
jgi:hypothetical protein